VSISYFKSIVHYSISGHNLKHSILSMLIKGSIEMIILFFADIYLFSDKLW